MDKPVVNRRFVRIKALQYLYAFYIHKQANYQLALDELAARFVPDVFAIVPANLEQLCREKEQAVSLFSSWATTQPLAADYPPGSLVEQAVKNAQTTYSHLHAQDINILKNTWQHTFATIRTTYLLIFQLMLEWLAIAQHQSQQHTTPLQPGITSMAVDLAHNPILIKLQANAAFVNLVQVHHITWTPHSPLVVRWYNQFIKESPALASNSTSPPTPMNHLQLPSYLLESIIFAQEDIQNLFQDIDISWSEHKPIVKKLLRQVLVKLEISAGASILEGIRDVCHEGAVLADFYDKLINTVLTKDKAIDQLMQQHSTNWSIQRMVWVDRILLKLALCEICYFDDIPAKVAINEYVELAKQYSTLKGASFINGILDTIYKTVKTL